MLRLIVLFLAFSASAVLAQTCAGTDQRTYLSSDERSELATRLSAYAFPEGNIWQARRGERTLTLIGTLHVGGDALSPVFQRAAPFVAQAEALLVEATPEGEQALARQLASDPSIAFLTEGPTLIDLLPAPLWEKIANAARERGIPAVMAAKSQPWFLSLSLAVPACAMRDLAGGALGLDKQLMAVAKENGVPLVALEDPLETIALLSADPLEVQLEYLALGVYDTQLAEDSLATLTALYLEGEHAASIEVSRFLARRSVPIETAEFDALFDEAMEVLLDKRNLEWIERIEENPSETLAIAFGAGHLSGPNGMLSLLQERGYHLTRID